MISLVHGQNEGTGQTELASLKLDARNSKRTCDVVNTSLKILGSGLRRFVNECRGGLLLETIVATAIFALVGTAVLAGLGTAYKVGAKTETQSVAENIARNQMEHIFAQPYREPDQTPYPTIILPNRYSVSRVATHLSGNTDPEVENISLTINWEGQEILVLDTVRLRTDRLSLQISTIDDRSNPFELHEAVLTGDAYVFLEDPKILVDTPVKYYLDGTLTNTEDFLQWDYAGSTGLLPTDPAVTWDTSGVANGLHIITAQATLADGNTVNITADFTTSN